MLFRGRLFDSVQLGLASRVRSAHAGLNSGGMPPPPTWHAWPPTMRGPVRDRRGQLASRLRALSKDGAMRLLVTFAGGTGLFLPTLPYARELRDRGHEVRYACQRAMVSVVEAAGFPAVDTGGAPLLPADERRPLAPVDRAHEQRMVADFFVACVGTERAA